MEGAGVGGLIAEVEGEQRGVGDLAGLRVEAGVLEGLGAVGEPWDSAMALIKVDSVSVEGWCSSARAAFNASKPLGSSVERRTKVPLWRARPWVVRFWEETARPASVFGPQESWALARLAVSWAAETEVCGVTTGWVAAGGGCVGGCIG